MCSGTGGWRSDRGYPAHVLAVWQGEVTGDAAAGLAAVLQVSSAGGSYSSGSNINNNSSSSGSSSGVVILYICNYAYFM